jgi:pimeloyl-ACP methyl ester carboxylesterase
VKVQCPVLLIHGLKDRYLMTAALNYNWSFVQRDLMLVTIPDADHFVQQEPEACRASGTVKNGRIEIQATDGRKPSVS